MAKVPYIPLYIGDWEQDTNCLSLQAEAAWLKIIIKMHKDDKSGIYKASTKSLQKLFKCDTNEVQNIICELIDNNIGIIEIDESGMVYTFKNRRMLKEKRISKVRTKAVQNRYKSSSKPLQNTEYDNENDIEDEIGIEEGVEGERVEGDPDAFIVPRMVTAWHKTFPKYLLKHENDFPALKDIAFALCDYLAKPKVFSDRSICDEILILWEAITGHIKTNDHYSTYNLQQVLKYIQSILQSYNKPVHQKPSDVQVMFDLYCEQGQINPKSVSEEIYNELHEKKLIAVDEKILKQSREMRLKILDAPKDSHERELHAAYKSGNTNHPLVMEDAKIIELHAKRTAVITFFKKQKAAKAENVFIVKK